MPQVHGRGNTISIIKTAEDNDMRHSPIYSNPNLPKALKEVLPSVKDTTSAFIQPHPRQTTLPRTSNLENWFVRI